MPVYDYQGKIICSICAEKIIKNIPTDKYGSLSEFIAEDESYYPQGPYLHDKRNLYSLKYCKICRNPFFPKGDT